MLKFKEFETFKNEPVKTIILLCFGRIYEKLLFKILKKIKIKS